MMHSLDDYYYFYLVVKHGGFSAAAEVSNITKSKLSRRIVELEERFAVSLIQRSTRHFRVTALGQEFYEECCKVLAQVECAENILLRQKSEPQGLIRISCPEVMMHFQIRSILNQFLKQYPKVELELELTSRRVDLMNENIDLAIRTNFQANENSSLIVRDVVKTFHCLVAHPDVIKSYPISDITDLKDAPTVVLGTQKFSYHWDLQHISTKCSEKIALKPRIKSNDLAGVYYSVKDGLGIADLPYLTVEEDIIKGNLVHVLPDWHSNIGTVQLVYASRKGQRLVLQKLIEALIEGLRSTALQQAGYMLL